MRVKLGLPLFVSFALSVLVDAQIFKATTELVTVPLSVTHRREGVVVGDLTPEDFRVTEDGVEQTVSLLDRQRRPISLCIVLDSSTSMRPPRQDHARLAVDHTLAALGPDDEFAVVVFARAVRTAVPWTRAGGRNAIAWSTYQLDDFTALNDGLKEALHLVEGARNERVAIVVVSDGQDTGSRIRLQDIVTTRRQSEVLVYAFRTDARLANAPQTSADVTTGRIRSGGDPSNGRSAFADQTPQDILPTLVGDSGGIVYPVIAPESAAAAATALVEELRNIYTLGYTPRKAPDGKYRRIKIEPRRSDLRVRHRGSYLASVPK
jgi:Ca-activated chloride channel homolog